MRLAYVDPPSMRNARLDGIISYSNCDSTDGSSLVYNITFGTSYFWPGTTEDITGAGNLGVAIAPYSSSSDVPYLTINGGVIRMTEVTAPSNPGASEVDIFNVDNTGKTETKAIYQTGSAVQVSIEP